jgi:hypothetical protein
MRIQIICAVMALTAAMAMPAEIASQGIPIQPTRFDVGVSVMLTEPTGEFRQNVGNSVGGGGFLLYHLDRPGWLSLRFDGSGASYGREEKSTRLSPTIPARVLGDITTANTLAGISFGPEFTVPKGRVRPYFHTEFSGLFLWTNSSLCCAQEGDIASTTNFKDKTRAWVYGSGVRILVSKARIEPMIDLGVRYHRGGQASYLREGSIQDNPDGSISFQPLTSRTPFVAYAVSFRFRIPYRSTSPCPRLLC